MTTQASSGEPSFVHQLEPASEWVEAHDILTREERKALQERTDAMRKAHGAALGANYVIHH